MKGIGCLIVSLLFTHAFSQQVELDIALGTNVLPVANSDYDNNYALGLHVGGGFTYKIASQMQLRSGLYFTQKENRYETYDTALVNLFGLEDQLPADNINLNQYTWQKVQVKQSYIEIPILFEYQYKAFTFFGGPYVGLLVQNRVTTRTVSEVPFLQTVDINSIDSSGFLAALLPPAYSDVTSESSDKEDFTRMDVGFRLGIGAETDFGIGARLNYSFGMIDYRKDSQSPKQMHNYFQATVFYKLPFN